MFLCLCAHKWPPGAWLCSSGPWLSLLGLHSCCSVSWGLRIIVELQEGNNARQLRDTFTSLFPIWAELSGCEAIHKLPALGSRSHPEPGHGTEGSEATLEAQAGPRWARGGRWLMEKAPGQSQSPSLSPLSLSGHGLLPVFLRTLNLGH